MRVAQVLAVVALGLWAVPAWGQSYEIVHRFATADGLPNPTLVQGADGHFYGTTVQGGDHGLGSVFRMTTNGILDTLYSFTGGLDGYQPVAGLIQASDGLFYGTAAEGGGEWGGGTVFRISAAGDLETIHTFIGPDGVEPNSPMVKLLQASDGRIYGATGNLQPTIFRIDPVTLDYEALYTFDEDTEGGEPTSLIQASDGNFYGTLARQFMQTSERDAGAIYRMDSNGVVTILHNFVDTDIYHPVTSLVQAADGFLYGLTAHTAFGGGGFYRIDMDGIYERLVVAGELEQEPYSFYLSQLPALAIGPGGLFYGSSSSGVFSLDSNDQSGASFIYPFDYDSPNHNLGVIFGTDGLLYGTDSGPGLGSIYRVATDGTAFERLVTFDDQDGFEPTSPLALGPDGLLYGTTSTGGLHGAGSVFRVNPSGGATAIHAFDFESSSGRKSILTVGPDQNLYGTTDDTGVSGSPSLFRVSPSGDSGLIHTFGDDIGTSPRGGLLLASDGRFYGVADGGGAHAQGTVYRYEPETETLSVLYSFGSLPSDGYVPTGTLVQGTDGRLYGTTQWGGEFDSGIVFAVDLAGNATILHSFQYDEATGVGARFPSSLVQAADGWFYGTTMEGGDGNPSDSGTIFRINDPGDFQRVHVFDLADGAYPTSPPIQAPDGLLYGITSDGGGESYAGHGVLYRLGRNDGVTVVKIFGENEDTEFYPNGPLARGADGLYYGTTYYSSDGGGVVFRVNLFSETPPGSNVEVQPIDPVTGTAPVNLTFGEVLTPGETTVAVNVAPSVEPPSGFNLGDSPVYFNVETTATFAGQIQVCFDYSNLSVPDPANASLLHHNGITWVDVTTSNDLATFTICGEVESLSPFVIGTAADTEGTTLVALGDARAWLGLKSSDDQGTRFDLLAELYRGSELVSSGLTRCIVGLVRNANGALETFASFGAFEPVPLESGQALTLRLSTRVGTNPNGTKCGGHNSAAGLRLYYDGATRPSGVEAHISPEEPASYYLHSNGATDELDLQPPSGPAKFKDSPAVTFSGGNSWKVIDEWILTVP